MPEFLGAADRANAPSLPGVRRVFLGFTLFVLGSIWLAIFYQVRTDQDAAQQAASDRAAAYALAASEHITGIFSALEQVSREIARDHRLQGKNFDAGLSLKAHSAFGPNIYQVSVVDSTGKLVATSLDSGGRVVDVSETRNFKLHSTSRYPSIFISPPVPGMISGRIALHISSRIDSDDGTFAGIVIISIEPGFISDYLKVMPIGRNGLFTFAGDDLIVRARATGSGNTDVGQNLAGGGLAQAAANAEKGQYRSKAVTDGIERIFAFRRIPDLQAIVTVGLAVDDVLADFRSRQQELILAGALLTFAILGLGFIMFRRMNEQWHFQKELDSQRRELLESKTKAELANRAKSMFLANMSHELRTPLNAIIGFSDVIGNQTFGPHAREKYIEYAKDINQSGEHLLKLINSILDMSKIDAGQETLDRTWVNPTELAEFCLMLVGRAADAKRIRIETRMAPDLAKVWADERALRQVITNVLSNAVKFTPNDGRVTFAISQTAAGETIMTIVDTGIGIPEGDLPNIATPFMQVQQGADKKFEGTGLGLAISKRLVEMHQGRLSISSTLGQGTIVTISLPAAHEEKQAA